MKRKSRGLLVRPPDNTCPKDACVEFFFRGHSWLGQLREYADRKTAVDSIEVARLAPSYAGLTVWILEFVDILRPISLPNHITSYIRTMI